jgi:DNA-binding beta-propeller fold protein YncE
MGLALLGDKLLITNSVSYGIDEYNAATGGTPIKVNFISGANGLAIPTAIAVSTDGKTVYVEARLTRRREILSNVVHWRRAHPC